VFQQGFDMLKKLAAFSQRFPQQLIFFVNQTHDGVKEKSQQVQTEQHGRQELRSMVTTQPFKETKAGI
jgi:hypothetical protein